MRVQLSSGNGPAECELAVGKFLDVLKKELPDLQILNETKGVRMDGYRSVVFTTEQDVSHLQGTVKWVSISPLRPQHKRKNWFIDVSLFDEPSVRDYSGDLIRYQTFRCRGHGGQNVNKVETGVRAIHIPTGMSATATEARTQHQNKKTALDRLFQMLAEQNTDAENMMNQAMHLQHELLERGSPVRTYTGAEFARSD